MKSALELKRSLCRAGVSGANRDITPGLQQALESAVAGARRRNAERYPTICQYVAGLESLDHQHRFLSSKGVTAEGFGLVVEGQV